MLTFMRRHPHLIGLCGLIAAVAAAVTVDSLYGGWGTWALTLAIVVGASISGWVSGRFPSGPWWS